MGYTTQNCIMLALIAHELNSFLFRKETRSHVV